MRKILIVLALAVVVIFFLGIIKDQVIKSVITVVASQVTAAPVHIDGFSLGVFSQSVRISGFKMYNPQGFSKSILVDLPRINVVYDLGALFKRKLHLVSAEIELREMGLEKNKEGKMNVDELKVVKQGVKQGGSKPVELMPIQIDMFKLGIGQIISKDYSAGPDPVVKVYNINIHKSYKNITSVEQLTALILAEPMKAAGIQGAKVYGAVMLAGVAVLPVAVAATFVGKDSVQQDFAADFDRIYDQSLSVMKRMGKITGEDKAAGIIKSDINSAQVTLKIKKKTGNKTQVIISARKYLLPKSEIAGGVLYEISKKIK
jgi:hypothetical protein